MGPLFPLPDLDPALDFDATQLGIFTANGTDESQPHTQSAEPEAAASETTSADLSILDPDFEFGVPS